MLLKRAGRASISGKRRAKSTFLSRIYVHIEAAA
jgi:hypothetical protein